MIFKVYLNCFAAVVVAIADGGFKELQNRVWFCIQNIVLHKKN